MMISINRPARRPQRGARSNGLLVLEPPRHSQLPISFLGTGKHLIGTADDCGVCLEAEGVLPHHAMILVSDQVILLKAIDSRTWVNDSAVTEIALRTGDRLSIGPITFRLRLATADELREVASAEVDGEPKAAMETNLLPPRAENRPSSSPKMTSNPEAATSMQTASEYSSLVTFCTETTPPSIRTDEPRCHTESSSTPTDLTASILPVHASMTSATSVAAEDKSQPTAIPSNVVTNVSEIERQISLLNDQSATFDALNGSSNVRESAHVSMEKQRLATREEELKRLADELSRQSQRLRERNDRIVEREEELERQQSLLSAEKERLVATAEMTRRELSDEYARQKTLWQEWDAAYHRTAEELKSQLAAVEERRAAIQAENEKLVADRAEIQRLHIEYENQRRAAAAERIQAATELSELHAQRAAFETERRQHFVNLQEREAQVASERNELVAAQDELMAARQQIEHDRTLFATERSSESLRREQEIREHTQARVRLNNEESELQSMRFEIEAARRALDEQKADFHREREQFEAARADVEEVRARLNKAEIERDHHHQLLHEQQTLKAAADEEAVRQREQLHDYEHTIEAQRRELESVHAKLLVEQQELAAAQDELARRPMLPNHNSARSASNDGFDRSEFSRTPTSVNDLLGISSSEYSQPADHTPVHFHLNSGNAIAFESESRSTENSTPSMALEMVAPATDWSSANPSADASSNNLEGSHVETHHAPDSQFAAVSENQDFGSERPIDPAPFTMFDMEVFEGESQAEVEEESAFETTMATAISDNDSVEDALAGISQRFGYTTPHETESSPSLESATNFAEESVSESLRNELQSPLSASGDADNTSSKSPDPTFVAVDNSLENLRAQLAQMFSLDEGTTSNSPQSTDGVSQTDDGGLISQNADISTDTPFNESTSGETTIAAQVDSAADVPTMIESVSISDATEGQAQEPAEEDEWTRRLRELSKVASPQTPPPPPVPTAVDESKSAEAETTAKDDDDEFSIEAQLARLLGKPRSAIATQPASPTTHESSSVRSAQKTVSQADSNPSQEKPQQTDRSHLTSEPKHKQNKNAVRQEVQSFRAVAQMSARTALAKHSWNNLKNEFYFTASVTAASSIASVWFLGSYIYGIEQDLWKGMICSIATVVCGNKLVRSSVRLKQCHGASPGRSDTEASTVVFKKKPQSNPSSAETIMTESVEDATPETE